MADQVLIVDDDTRLSAMLADYLTGNGFEVRAAATATTGLAEIARNEPHAVILDIMLPDLDGFETCRRIRASSDVPVLMLTAKGEETDRNLRRDNERGARLAGHVAGCATPERLTTTIEGSPA